MQRNRDCLKSFIVVLGKLVYVILFNSWLIWHLDPSLLGTSAGCMAVPLVLFLIVLVNEGFVDKVRSQDTIPYYTMSYHTLQYHNHTIPFHTIPYHTKLFLQFKDLNSALYNLEWFNFPVVYRKDFVFILKASDRPILLSEGGMHDLTFEWFGDLLKSSYNAGLFLQKMIA